MIVSYINFPTSEGIFSLPVFTEAAQASFSLLVCLFYGPILQRIFLWWRLLDSNQ